MKLSVSNLSKTFTNKKAVDQFSYDFENGIYGLLGPNGSGKSTLMRMLCDILKPTDGSITLDGVKTHDLDDEFRNILGYLPQDFGYYPQFTAYDFLMYFAALKGYNNKEAISKVEEVLQMVSLVDVKKHKIKTFSGGMKQRLGIAQALLNDPKILIVDEPTAGLDPKERNKFKNILARCAKDKIVILSTHIVSDVENIANKIIIMKDGKNFMHGTRDALLTNIKDKVFTLPCTNEQIDELKDSITITGMTPIEAGVQLRVVGDIPLNENMHKEVPTLEDLYLLIFKDD